LELNLKNRATVLAVVFLLVVLALAVKVFYDNFKLHIRQAFAEEQTEVIEATRNQALKAEVKKEAELLEYIVNYYPSGTKQIKGSKLDLIVERFRGCVVREIIADLRKKTREDFGDRPEEWIRNLR
jgi:hypothetical protein